MPTPEQMNAVRGYDTFGNSIPKVPLNRAALIEELLALPGDARGIATAFGYSIEVGRHKTYSYNAKIEFHRRQHEGIGPCLSVVGDVIDNSKRGDNRFMTCGQCFEAFGDITTSSLPMGYTVSEFIAKWERWHLNDMRPGCEHQRDWGKKSLTLVTYSLSTETYQNRERIKNKAMDNLKKKGSAEIKWDERVLLNLPWEKITPEDHTIPFYDKKKTETKLSGWVNPSEHPEGELCKPCPTCGYKYGTAWLYEPLPLNVIEFFLDLAPKGMIA